MRFDLLALKKVIAKVLQLPDTDVIEAWQQAPVGKKSFVTVRELTSVQLGSEYKFDGEEEEETITDSKETTVSVNAYGTSANRLLEKLVGALKTSVAMQMLKRAGMAVPRTSAIRNLTQALGGGYEERAQVDLTVSHIYRLKTEMTRADSVEITVKTDTNQITVEED